MTDTPPQVNGPPSRAWLALALLVPAPTIGTLMAMVIAPGSIGSAVFFASKIWVLLLPIVWYIFVEGGKPSLSPMRRGGLGVGFITGLLMIAVMFGTYFLIGKQWIDAENVAAKAVQNGIGTPTRFIVMVLFWVFVNSLMEEYVWRWFVVQQCERVMRSRTAIVVSGFLFTVHHIVALRVQFDWRVTILASVGVWAAAMVWSWLYIRYRSIWPCYLSHLLADVPIFVIGWWLIFG